MLVSVKKPGTPAELVHFGIKGMKWGVRRERTSSGSTGIKKPWSKKKKIAVGVGVGAAILAGAVVAGVILKRSGKLPVSPLSNRHPHEVQRILDQGGKVSRREWKRLVGHQIQNQEWRTRMKSLEMEATRNMARRAKGLPPEYYIK